MECNYVLVKTELGNEVLAASHIRDIDPGARVVPSPRGLRGLVLVEPSMSKEEVARLIKEKVPEATKVIVALRCVEADPDKIAKAAAEVAKDIIKARESFAVRTTRRGKHVFTSIDVNVAAGRAVQEATDASVNLREPDWVVAVEILRDLAIIAVYPGSEEWRKFGKGKRIVRGALKKVSVGQIPFLGPLDACREMGARIGRGVQNFEVGEYVVLLDKPARGEELAAFLAGLKEGINARYEVQRRTYSGGAWCTPTYVYEIYQFVRARSNEPIIVFEPEGDYVLDRVSELRELFRRRRVNMLFGSRVGVPEGVYRFADLVLDIAPGVTLSTEFAVPAALMAVLQALYPWLGGEES